MGHQFAVRVRNWCLTASHETLGGATISVVGRVDSFDSLWSTKSPAKLGLWMGESWWVWGEAHYHPPKSVGGRIEIDVTGNPVAKRNFGSRDMR